MLASTSLIYSLDVVLMHGNLNLNVPTVFRGCLWKNRVRGRWDEASEDRGITPNMNDFIIY